MNEEAEKLRAIVVYLITMLKSNAEMTARISAELAAVSVAVAGLDPTFDDVLQQKRAEVDEISDPIVRANLDRFDEMIQRVQSGEFL